MPENLWQTKSDSVDQKKEAPASSAPPPPEVKVRTMRSDLESMAQSGGGLPKFQKVKVPQLAISREESIARSEKASPIWNVIIPIVLAGVVVAIGFFAYQVFLRPRVATPTQVAVPRPVPGAQAPTAVEFVHNSLFKKSADKTLTFVVSPVVESASDLQTHSQRMKEFLSEVDPSLTFLEIRTQGVGGRDFAVDEILSLADALVLPSQFLLSHFYADSTAFVYVDDGSFWPGYVLALQPAENWLFLRDEVIELEGSSKLENFFLTSPGNPSEGGFKDTIISGQPARVLSFSSGASFVYGWFRGHLILSTSEEGLREALSRL